MNTIVLFTYIGFTTFAKMAKSKWQLMKHNVFKHYMQNTMTNWSECNYDVWIHKILYSIKIAVMTIYLTRYRIWFKVPTRKNCRSILSKSVYVMWRWRSFFLFRKYKMLYFLNMYPLNWPESKASQNNNPSLGIFNN